ncbi:MAG TPA: aminopeptidase P family N-terminal domain-containing protein, partial [Nannocystaceae bacterium]|nr:aminopeptidase P family N-terminal domain-containing protein [Nannocystaceae bacterium]
MRLRRRTTLRWLGAAWIGAPALACRPRADATREPTTSPIVASSTPPVAEDDPFVALHGASDGITPPDAAELAAHREAARVRMREQDIAAVIVEPSASLDWLGGPRWHRSERPLLMILPREGEPKLLAPAFERRTVAERVPELSLVLWREHEDPFAVLRGAVSGL